jgi:hypothetical protein
MVVSSTKETTMSKELKALIAGALTGLIVVAVAAIIII